MGFTITDVRQNKIQENTKSSSQTIHYVALQQNTISRHWAKHSTPLVGHKLTPAEK